MTARWITADVFDGLATLETGSVDLVVTSPPFLALRSYLPADHPDKGKEIGSEATPAEFIDVLLRVTAELRRVLAPHGSICVELGDTYAGSGGGGGDYLENGWREGQQQFAGSEASMRESNAAHWRQKNQDKNAWPLSKSRTLIPQLYEIALAYGINPLTGSPSPAGQWRIRNVVTWARPNPPVGALGDKWRPATSDLIVACVSPKRYWDDLATRKPQDPNRVNRLDSGQFSNRVGGMVGLREGKSDSDPTYRDEPGDRVLNPSGAPLLDYWEIPLLEGEEPKQYGPKEKAKPTHMGGKQIGRTWHTGNDDDPNYRPNYEDRPLNEAGAPLLDYWEIPPGGYKGSHYAVFPEELVVPCVKAMCPEKVCRTCGEPSRRISEIHHENTVVRKSPKSLAVVEGKAPSYENTNPITTVTTLGWTDCGHGSIVCSSCSALVPLDYVAIRRSREGTQLQGGVGQEEILGKSVQGSNGQAEASEGVRGLRGGLSSEDARVPSVQPVLFGEARPHGRADESDRRPGGSEPNLEGWPEDQPSGLRSDLGAAGVPGPTEERLHDGAPGGDAGTSRAHARPSGVGSPQERDQGRQPARELGDCEPRKAGGSGDLPELPDGVPDPLVGYVCACGSTEFKYVADHWRPGLILDPFAGSGTTLSVATGHGHDAVGIDLDPRNADLARDRIGPFLFEETRMQ